MKSQSQKLMRPCRFMNFLWHWTYRFIKYLARHTLHGSIREQLGRIWKRRQALLAMMLRYWCLGPSLQPLPRCASWPSYDPSLTHPTTTQRYTFTYENKQYTFTYENCCVICLNHWIIILYRGACGTQQRSATKKCQEEVSRRSATKKWHKEVPHKKYHKLSILNSNYYVSRSID